MKHSLGILIFLVAVICQVGTVRRPWRGGHPRHLHVKERGVQEDIDANFDKPAGSLDPNVILTVVILPGGFVRQNGRELGVVIRGLANWQIQKAMLEVFENDTAPTSVLVRVKVAENIDERVGNSIKMRLGHRLPSTSWTIQTIPTQAKYTAIVVVEGRVLAKNELFPRPKWMQEMLSTIGYLPLIDLAIPGTHQSGAYRRYDIGDIHRPKALTLYHQEEDVLTQLIYGIRFLDLRVITKSNASRTDYWIESGGENVGHRLKEILDDVNAFLNQYPKEIVFIDFVALFREKSEYDGLAKLVSDTFDTKLYVRKPQTNLFSVMRQRFFQVIKDNRRVLVSYRNYKRLEGDYYPGVRRIQLKSASESEQPRISELQDQYQNKYMWFYGVIGSAIQANATGDISARGIADRTNFPLTSWYHENEAIRNATNILAVDYFAGTDVVSLCERINLERGKRYAEYKE